MNKKEFETKRGTFALDVRKESKKMTVVTHKSLEKVFNELSLKANYTPINSPYSAVFLCEIAETTEIGEARFDSNKNEFSGLYPFTLAFQRAFDRAMIKVLGLESTYSTNEIPAKEWDSSYVPEETTSTEDDIFTNPSIEEKEENPVVEDNDFEEIIEEEPSEDAGEYVFSQGKYKGKSINELFVDNPGYLEYCAFTGTKTSSEVKEAIMKFYRQKGLHKDKM